MIFNTFELKQLPIIQFEDDMGESDWLKKLRKKILIYNKNEPFKTIYKCQRESHDKSTAQDRHFMAVYIRDE